MKVSARKSKGSSFEYDCQHSLSAIYPNIYRTSERGFQRQFDLCCESSSLAIECKKHKEMSWNKAKKLYEKLCKVSKMNHNYLLFKPNQNPCLVFFEETKGQFTIKEFEHVFNCSFEVHPSTRAKKD